MQFALTRNRYQISWAFMEIKESGMDNKNSEISATLRLLQCLDVSDHLELSRLGKRCFIEKNSFAFQVGEPDDNVYLVERGRFKVFQSTPDGKNILLFCRISGEFMGLRGSLWSHGTYVRTYSAQACENSEILTISVSRFMAYAAAHPKLALNVAQILSQRLDDVSGILTDLTLTNTTTRVARLILHCYRCYGLHVTKSMDMGVPLSQQEIADMAGVARQTVSGILSEFKVQGVVSVTHKHIRIECESKLVKLAYSDCTQES
jgi:CRP-like cAMP-binding protein